MGSFFELMPLTGFLLELDKREGIEEALVPPLEDNLDSSSEFMGYVMLRKSLLSDEK